MRPNLITRTQVKLCGRMQIRELSSIPPFNDLNNNLRSINKPPTNSHSRLNRTKITHNSLERTSFLRLLNFMVEMTITIKVDKAEWDSSAVLTNHNQAALRTFHHLVETVQMRVSKIAEEA